MTHITPLTPSGMDRRLKLRQVTLCAVTSVNVAATIRALVACLEQIEFASCKLFTDAAVMPGHQEIEVQRIAPLRSSAEYSDFVLRKLADHVETDHCLIVQWDGQVLDARSWRNAFLDYDYIGARWPQFDDGHDVGNGGFSLRSRRLMLACRDAEFCAGDVEDVAIGRTNRVWLEGRGMRFAPAALADAFAAERAGDLACSFGYHGAFNMPQALGTDQFWEIYRELDDRSTIWHSFRGIICAIGRGPNGVYRVARLLMDRARSLFTFSRTM